MMYCNDADLLHWEPDVLADAAFASQGVCAGTCDVDNGVLTITAGPSAVDQQVTVGQVVVLSGAAAGCLVVTGVPSATELAVSALWADLVPASGPAPAALSAFSASGAAFVIRTFYAQRKVTSDFLLRALGLDPDRPGDVSAVMSPHALKRACALGTLQLIYSAIAAAADEPARFAVRADLYERLYRRALRAAQVDLDLNGDGRTDARRSPGLVTMVRG